MYVFGFFIRNLFIFLNKSIHYIKCDYSSILHDYFDKFYKKKKKNRQVNFRVNGIKYYLLF